MTEKLYWEDQTMKEFYASVVESSGNEIILDKTAFYPRGGGQPSDTGILKLDGTVYTVEKVEKRGDDVVHFLSEGEAPESGANVFGRIDWDRRYSHMRFHTAIHVLDGVVTNHHSSEGTLTGGQIYHDRARIDFDMEGLDREKVQELIDETNETLSSGLKVYSKEIPSEEALSMPNISRTLPGKELLSKLESVRIVVIEGLDEQADGGTHVSNTKEVGKIVLKKVQSKGRRNKRVEFYLESS